MTPPAFDGADAAFDDLLDFAGLERLFFGELPGLVRVNAVETTSALDLVAGPPMCGPMNAGRSSRLHSDVIGSAWPRLALGLMLAASQTEIPQG